MDKHICFPALEDIFPTIFICFNKGARKNNTVGNNDQDWCVAAFVVNIEHPKIKTDMIALETLDLQPVEAAGLVTSLTSLVPLPVLVIIISSGPRPDNASLGFL